MIGLLPAAGLATRMGGLPKFLLPLASTSDTLLGRHLDQMSKHVDQVIIITRPENAPLLARYLGKGVAVVVAETRSMSETVHHALAFSSGDTFLLGMPDTCFLGESPYQRLAELRADQADVGAALWKLREDQRGRVGQVDVDSSRRVVASVDKDPGCVFPYFWGAMMFTRASADLLDPETPHIGYLLQPAVDAGLRVQGAEIAGEYFDCGTPGEFRALLNKVLEIEHAEAEAT